MGFTLNWHACGLGMQSSAGSTPDVPSCHESCCGPVPTCCAFGAVQAAASAAAASIGRTISGGTLKEGAPAPSAVLPDIPEAAPSDPPSFNQPSVALSLSAAANVAAALAPASSSQVTAQESVAALAADSGFQGTPDSASLWAGLGGTLPMPASAGAMPVGTGMDLQPPSAQQMPVASTGGRALETPTLPELPASGSAQRQPAAGLASGNAAKEQQAVAALPVAGAATERALSGYAADTEEADVSVEASAATSHVATGTPGSGAQSIGKPAGSEDMRPAALAETISGALVGAGAHGEAATGATGREAGQARPDHVKAGGPKAAALAETVSGALSAAGEGHTSGTSEFLWVAPGCQARADNNVWGTLCSRGSACLSWFSFALWLHEFACICRPLGACGPGNVVIAMLHGTECTCMPAQP